MTLRVGLKLSGQETTAEELRAVWRVADGAGFDHCWNFDHFAGLGAAWAEIEHTMLDLEFGTAGQRIARMDEALRMLKLLWSEERSDFEGRYYRLDGAIANPKPVQRPHPPIWIGGSGERKTLRVVAEHADAWNAPGGEPAEFARLSGVLDRHCDDVGRDPAQIRRTVQVGFRGDADDLLAKVESFRAVGVDDVIVTLFGGEAERHATEAAELLPRLRSA